MDAYMTEIQFLFRWFHLLAGVCWIGILYYFNFVQVPFFAETEANVRMGAISKLVPRALWWFRWAAMVTFLTGLVMVLLKMHQLRGAFFESSYGWAITLGGLLGTMMWANVWFVIWPNQKVVIASAQGVVAGGTALPEAAACGRRAALTSRTNVVFSVPMLFFMGAASHLPLFAAVPENAAMVMPLVCLALIGAIEANALVGTQGPTKKPLDTIPGAIHAGFALTVVFFVLFKVLF